MIEVKEAVKKGLELAAGFFPGLRDSLRLEEVGREAAEWTITVSMPRPEYAEMSAIRSPRNSSLLTGPIDRDYKRIVIDANSGEFVRMEVRQF